MKFSYRTHPILSILGKKELDFEPLFEIDSFYRNEIIPVQNEIKNGWSLLQPYAASDIKIITRPACEAMEPNVYKLRDIEPEGFVGSQKGLCLNVGAFSFVLSSFDEGPFFIFKGMHLFGFRVFDFAKNEVLICSKYAKEIPEHRHLTDAEIVVNWMIFAKDILRFLKYAEIETKILPPKSRSKDIRCKYVNDTDSRIEYIDSTWFTTLVKSDAFKVRGHFRLQACGEGLKDRKLIWVNEFQKDGYTAPARKLQAQ